MKHAALQALLKTRRCSPPAAAALQHLLLHGSRCPRPRPRVQNLPFYRIVVAEAKSKRDGRHFEQVGWYDPHPGECRRRADACPAHVRSAAGPVQRAAACRGRKRAEIRSCKPARTLLQALTATPFPLAHPAPDGNKHIGLNFDRIK